MSPDVFISYSRENQQEVIKLVEYLREQGLGVWMDETDIHGATMWTKEIVEAIRASSCSSSPSADTRPVPRTSSRNSPSPANARKSSCRFTSSSATSRRTMEYQLAGIQNIALFTLDKAKASRVCPPNDSSPRHWPSAGGRPSGVGTERGPRHRRWPRHMAPPKAKGGAGKWIGIAAAVVVLAAAGFS